MSKIPTNLVINFGDSTSFNNSLIDTNVVKTKCCTTCIGKEGDKSSWKPSNGFLITITICSTLIIVSIIVKCTLKNWQKKKNESEMEKRKAETKKKYQEELAGYIKEKMKDIPLGTGDPYVAVLKEYINETKPLEFTIDKSTPKKETQQKEQKND